MNRRQFIKATFASAALFLVSQYAPSVLRATPTDAVPKTSITMPFPIGASSPKNNIYIPLVIK